MANPGGPDRVVDLPGPWTHRDVAANGARFHLVEADTPDGFSSPRLVILLHGFPHFWWAWRHQLPALAAAGYRAVAMDLRGYGGSDKTREGYDPQALSRDVSGVVKALGERNAAVVGQGWGGYVAWATATLHPREVAALGVVSAPHPRAMLRGLSRHPTSPASRHLLAMQLPWRPERRLADPASGFLGRHLREWASPSSGYPDAEVLRTYQDAIGLWPSSHCALEYHRWVVRSRVRADGRTFNQAMRAPVGQPVLSVRGADDVALPAGAFAATHRHVVGPLTESILPAAGHFAPEEAPAAFNEVLLSWLGEVSPP